MSDARLVFKNVHLVDGQSPGRSGMTVAVEGERITRVVEDAAFASEAKPDDRTIDLGGKTLMPGMVQTHFHSHFGAFGEGVTAPSLGLEASPPYLMLHAAQNASIALDNGVTSAIGSSNAFAIDIALKEGILMGLCEGPRYLAGSRELVVTSDASDYDNNRNFFMELGCTGLTAKADGVEGWRKAVRVEIGRGADVVKISAGPGHGSSPAVDYMYLTKDELRAATDEALKRGRQVRAHAPSKTSILECAKAGVSIIDHADRIDDECIEAILDKGAFVVPSMLWSQRFLDIAESWDHDAHHLDITEGFRETPDQVRARIAKVRVDWEYACEALPAAARAGVPMVVGDDYGTPIMPHGDYGAELELYVKTLGVPALDVITWATKNGAAAMKMGDDLGTIEEGKLADLVVVDGDPLTDISVLVGNERIKAVVLNGEFVRSELD